MPPPPMIGRLRVERQLGTGGFATVWLAHDPELDDAVAVKVLAENWAGEADVRRRFVDEARLLRRVDSDHLVRVHDIGELPDGRPYFVMTYADRGSLAERLRAAPPPWRADSVCALIDAIAAGLAVVHRHGVVHRDVKPRNVLLRSDRNGTERVLLGDLGIAKDLRWASGLTTPVGSPRYMPPEQRTCSDQVGPASDVFALAMTAAELLDLTEPWPASPLGDTLTRATWPDPARRISSATDFAAELRAALAAGTALRPHSGPRSGPPFAPTPAPPFARTLAPTFAPPAGSPGVRPARRGLPGGRVLAGVTVAALAVGGWWVTHRGGTLSPINGKVFVGVPSGWTRTAAVAFPGDDDADAGARAGNGGRSIAVAFSSSYQEPATVAERVTPQGCTTSTATPNVRTVTVGPWQGAVRHHDGCTDGSSVDEVALGNQGSNEWSVWVEVRSKGGDPDLSDVLSSLRIEP